MILFTICGIILVGIVVLCLRDVPKDVEDQHMARLNAKNKANSKFNYAFYKDEIRHSKDFQFIGHIFPKIETIEVDHSKKTVAKENGLTEGAMPKNKPADALEEELLIQRIHSEVGSESTHNHDKHEDDDIDENEIVEDISPQVESEYDDLLDVIEVKLG